MKLLSHRLVSALPKRILYGAFIIGVLLGSNIVFAQSLPSLSLGVNFNSQYNYTNDIDPNNWFPDHRIWTVPSRVSLEGIT